jgi:hypothetical protein
MDLIFFIPDTYGKNRKNILSMCAIWVLYHQEILYGLFSPTINFKRVNDKDGITMGFYFLLLGNTSLNCVLPNIPIAHILGIAIFGWLKYQ